jgi:glycerate 2-kinase
MPPHEPTSPAAQVAGEVFRSALVAADPSAATRAALARTLELHPAARTRWHWIIATGKAAPAMARAAVEFLAEHHLQFAGGIVVAERNEPAPHPHLRMHVGDHPIPGPRSLACANAIATLADEVAPGDRVLALISGGTSALIGAPVDDVRLEDLAALNALLLDSGLPIRATNAIRKRFARWGAGRLALAFAPSAIHPVILSDVVGDDPIDIASGPYSPDPLRAAEVEQLLRETELARRLPLSMAAYIGAVRNGDRPETSKPDSPALAHVRPPVVIGRREVLDAAAQRARALGRTALTAKEPLVDEAAHAGRALARAAWFAAPGSCLIAGGETTVELPLDHGTGGRNQQLALAAELHELAQAALRDPAAREQPRPRVMILAAGTDGRDGPTDATGAIIDERSWGRMVAAGLDPASHLRRCDAYPALDRIGALLRTGPTGTNLADIVVALRD